MMGTKQINKYSLKYPQNEENWRVGGNATPKKKTNFPNQIPNQPTN
jgi:hypothetical protein